jgi:flagellar biosynthesis regulator FlbT
MVIDIEVNDIQLQNDLSGSPVRPRYFYIQAVMIDPVSESSRKTRFVMLCGHRVGR